MTVAGELARRIVASKFEQFTPEVVHYAKIGLLDTLGVGIAGSCEPAAVIARRVVGNRPGDALVWGTGQRSDPLEAAFLNGIAANVLDFDDCTDNLGGHPSAPVLPALFALGEKLGASGRDVITAYVVGFEIETQLGRGLNFHHYEKGWHPTSTLGVFGAGAASAKLLGLDEERTTHTLALCASMASGLKSNLGSMGKPMHVGQCSRNGLLAALLASEGFTANTNAFEHHQGFFEVFNGKGTYSVDQILHKWGNPWEIEMPGIAVKQYPCCLGTQSAVDLMLQLVRGNDVRAKEVTEISVKTSARRLEHTNRPEPHSALDAKLSIQYVLARALLDRSVTLEHFAGDTFKSAAVRDAMALIRAAPFDKQDVRDMGAEIAIQLANGRIVSGSIDRPIGHAAGQPISKEALETKFKACARQHLSSGKSEQIIQSVADFERLNDVRSLIALLEHDPEQREPVFRKDHAQTKR
jgi:2-methylcitrate dehydratase PrpD